MYYDNGYNIVRMCGIWGLLSQTKIQNFGQLYEAFMKIQSRGPDNSSFQLLNPFTLLGFHRLAIMDLTAEGNQPFHHVRQDGSCVYCVCNGEIYPHEELKKEYDIITKSHSDCEVIIPLYEKVGVEKLCKLLGSEFAFIIFDISKDGHVKMIAGRDPIGVRPIFYAVDNQSLCISSEMKGMSDIYDKCYVFPPGHFMTYENGKMELTSYYKYEYKELDPVPDIGEIYSEIRKRLTNAVRKRLYTDRELGFLLSGGVDSSLVCGIAVDLITKEFPDLMKIPIKFFTIQLEGGSVDVPYAIEVFEFLKKKHLLIEHHVFTVTEKELITMLLETSKIIECWDTTTNRASSLQLSICKYVQENTQVRVLFCGENADECCASYAYFHNAPSKIDAKVEAISLVKNVHTSDALRTDRSMAHFSIEARVPFADIEFIDYYLSLPPELIAPIDGLEKHTLRYAFKNQNIIPESVLLRRKCAFSDSTSKKERSWYQIIQEHMNGIISDEEFTNNKDKYEHCPPYTKENYYYRKKFVEYYGNSEEKAKTIPYFWMPKWVPANITDPSARTLANYKE